MLLRLLKAICRGRCLCLPRHKGISIRGIARPSHISVNKCPFNGCVYAGSLYIERLSLAIEEHVWCPSVSDPYCFLFGVVLTKPDNSQRSGGAVCTILESAHGWRRGARSRRWEEVIAVACVAIIIVGGKHASSGMAERVYPCTGMTNLPACEVELLTTTSPAHRDQLFLRHFTTDLVISPKRTRNSP